jgi:hypothetical protein
MTLARGRPHRRRLFWAAPIVAGAALASCGHGAGGAPACLQGDRPSNDCCLAAMNEGDVLSARGDKQAAHDRYEAVRSACVWFHPVRRRMFLLLQGAPKEPPGEAPARMDVSFDVELDLQLGHDVKRISHLDYLDGELLSSPGGGRTVKDLTAGPHELAVEVYLTTYRSRYSHSTTRLDVRQTIEVPAALAAHKGVSTGVIVHIKDRGGGGSLQERLSFESEARPFESSMQLDAVMVAPNTGSQLLLTNVNQDPYRPRLPAAWEGLQNRIWGLFKICVAKDGTVLKVTTIKSADDLVDSQWRQAMRSWRYRPYQVDGSPRAFCYPARIQVSGS